MKFSITIKNSDVVSELIEGEDLTHPIIENSLQQLNELLHFIQQLLKNFTTIKQIVILFVVIATILYNN